MVREHPARTRLRRAHSGLMMMRRTPATWKFDPNRTKRSFSRPHGRHWQHGHGSYSTLAPDWPREGHVSQVPSCRLGLPGTGRCVRSAATTGSRVGRWQLAKRRRGRVRQAPTPPLPLAHADAGAWPGIATCRRGCQRGAAGMPVRGAPSWQAGRHGAGSPLVALGTDGMALECSGLRLGPGRTRQAAFNLSSS